MDVCGSVGRKSTWEQITFYVETIKQSTTIKGLENYGLSFIISLFNSGLISDKYMVFLLFLNLGFFFRLLQFNPKNLIK